MFASPAVERASTSTWDIANQCVVSDLDADVNELGDNPMDEDYIFTNLATVVAQANPADGAKPAAKPSPHVGPSDKDSVSTLRSGISKRNKENSSPSSASKMSGITASERSVAATERNKENSSPSYVSKMSTVTASERSVATTETRLSVMDRSIQSLVATNIAAQQKMDRMQAAHEAALKQMLASHEASQALNAAARQRNDNTQLSILDAMNQLVARLPPPSSPPLSALPSNPPPGFTA
jgi:hypothetical protein